MQDGDFLLEEDGADENSFDLKPLTSQKVCYVYEYLSYCHGTLPMCVYVVQFHDRFVVSVRQAHHMSQRNRRHLITLMMTVLKIGYDNMV